jgi:hypothetical protein
VLTKAVQRLMQAWNMSNKDLALIIGVSTSFVTRMQQGTAHINPTSKEGELALMLIRSFRSLGAFLGERMNVQQAWLRAHHHTFNTTPLEAMKSVSGLALVAQYLDAMRGAQG